MLSFASTGRDCCTSSLNQVVEFLINDWIQTTATTTCATRSPSAPNCDISFQYHGRCLGHLQKPIHRMASFVMEARVLLFE